MHMLLRLRLFVPKRSDRYTPDVLKICFHQVVMNNGNDNNGDNNTTNTYSQLSSTHIFTPVAIETAGTWHYEAVQLVQELERRATIIRGDSRETAYLFQQLSVALQKGN